MDPEVTIELINDAIFTGELQEAYEHIENLDEWILKNSMIPWGGINANHDLLVILKRGILQSIDTGESGS